MEPIQSIRERIFAAADSLYAECERGNFPTVDAVRKKARVNMNDASTGMKEWRRAQSTTANPVPPQLPPELQASCSSALAVLWTEATALAVESLRAAQVGWDAERRETEELARQMAAAYDLQAAELETAQDQVKRLNADAAAMRVAMESAQSALEAAERTKALAEGRTSQAELQAVQIERRADELRKELDHAHEEASKLRGEISAIHEAHARQMERVHADTRRDLAAEREKCAQEQARTQLALSQVAAEAATLKGKLEVLETLQAKRPNGRSKSTRGAAASNA